MQIKLLDLSKEVDAINNLLENRWEDNPFRRYIVAETFNIASKFAEYHFSTTQPLYYCSHIVKERANMKNWRKKINQNVILACDPALIFAQKIAIEQMLFQAVNDSHSGRNQAYKKVIDFVNKEHSKFLLNVPKSWKAAKNIDGEIELQNIRKKLDNSMLKNSDTLEKFTLQNIYESSLKGLAPAEHLLKTIIELSFECTINNNNQLLDHDFKTLENLTLSADNFNRLPYKLDITPEMFKSEIAKKLFFKEALPGYKNEEDYIEAMKKYSIMDDETEFLTDIEYDVIPAIIDEEKNIGKNMEIFSNEIKNKYLDIYIKKTEE